MIQSLLKLPRIYRKILIFSFDFTFIIGSVFFSYFIRLGYWFFPANENDFFIISIGSPLLALPIFIQFKLYDHFIRYLSFKTIWIIFKAVSIYAILWGLIIFIISTDGFGDQIVIPRSVPLINWLLVLVFVISSRLTARWLLESNKNHKKTNVLIYGAGSAGRQLTTALKESNEYKPVAFLDDSKELHHKLIQGLEVLSPSKLSHLINKKNIKEIFIAIPSLSRSRRSGIVKLFKPYSVIVRSLPGVSELAQGKIKINDLLEINIGDLLGRNAISPNENLLKTNISNKVVLVTGAGGSIGSELSRQILLQKPEKLLIYDISESSLYVIEQELKEIDIPDVKIYPIIGSVGDFHRMNSICKSFKVNTIYHAAAYKHVPLVEQNPSQGILNNIIGTWTAAEAAINAKVETFVLISTDKAVRPTSVMGASKRAAELVLQAFDKQNHSTCFAMVRFGNVLDSSGSVIPLFKKQIESGGPVTVTHTDVVRYFMTIPEAVELVIQAGAMSNGGDVFVLDMGKPIRIYDLAVKMIELSGLTVLNENNSQGDIKIEFTGLRPGEKLYEELLVDGDFISTKHKLIMRAKEEMISWDKLEPNLIKIREAAAKSNTEESYKLLKQIVPQYNLTTNKI